MFIIETLPHADFTRRNDDLHMDLDILLVDALVRYRSDIRGAFRYTFSTMSHEILINEAHVYKRPRLHVSPLFQINYLEIRK